MLLTPQQWQEACTPTDPHAPENLAMSLNAYAEKCSQQTALLAARYPGVRWDNKRYVIHLERGLRAGEQPTAEMLAAVEENCNRYGDCPLVAEAKTRLARVA